MTRLSAAAGIAIALASPAFCQSADPVSPAAGNPGGMPPGAMQSAPGMPAPGQINQADRAFIHAATAAGLAEVKMGDS